MFDCTWDVTHSSHCTYDVSPLRVWLYVWRDSCMFVWDEDNTIFVAWLIHSVAGATAARGKPVALALIAHTHTCTWTRTHTHTHTYTYAYTYTYTHTYTPRTDATAARGDGVALAFGACVHRHTHTHAQTHTHTHTQVQPPHVETASHLLERITTRAIRYIVCCDVLQYVAEMASYLLEYHHYQVHIVCCGESPGSNALPRAPWMVPRRWHERVVVCCSALQRVAACCSVNQKCDTADLKESQCVAACCSVWCHAADSKDCVAGSLSSCRSPRRVIYHALPRAVATRAQRRLPPIRMHLNKWLRCELVLAICIHLIYICM